MTDRLLQRRGAGVLLPLFSLPGPYGIGTMGAAAYRFVDDLSSAGQRYWQLLPLCPAGQGNSPYQSPGSFAGDGVYIDPQLLVESGYLQPSDLDLLPSGRNDRVDYPAVRRGRQVLFDRLFDRFARHIPADFDCFCQSQSDWLEDHALFCALSERYGKRFFCGRRLCGSESRRLWRGRQCRWSGGFCTIKCCNIFWIISGERCGLMPMPGVFT